VAFSPAIILAQVPDTIIWAFVYLGRFSTIVEKGVEIVVLDVDNICVVPHQDVVPSTIGLESRLGFVFHSACGKLVKYT
jgi:hypothetical protein